MQLITTLHVKNWKSDHPVFSTRQANAYANGVKDGPTPNKTPNTQCHVFGEDEISVTKTVTSSVGRASNWKARCNTDVGSSPKCSKGFFSQSQLPVQTLFPCLYSPCVQMHVPPSARTLKIQTLAATPSCGHTKTLHTPIGMGSAALAAAVSYPGKATWISHKGQWSKKKIFYKRHHSKLNHSLCIPLVHTVPHGGQMESLWGKRQDSARNLFSTNQHSTTVVRWKACE